MQRRIYVVAQMLLVFMSSIVLSTVVLFICGKSINYLNLIISIPITCCYRYIFFEKNFRCILGDCMITGLVLLICCLFSWSVFDHTYDGAAYHKTAVGLLKEGWNPFFVSADEYNNSIHSIISPHTNSLLWAESYPKASWYFSSTIYYLTKNIECGKCYTLLFAFVSFGLCLEFFSKKLNKIQAYTLSLIATFNPIVCAQLHTYYLDGIVACILTMLTMLFLGFLDGADKCKEKGITVFLLLVWGCNLKFNVILYIATACLVYCACLSIKEKKLQIKRTFILIGEGVFSIFLVGFAPYITNLIRHGNIFYGFTSLLDEKMFQTNFGIKGISVTGRFWTSLFGRMSHGQYHDIREVLKIPFTFKMEEIHFYTIPDTRVSGFGVMFSGLFVIFVVVIIGELVNRCRRKRFNIAYIFCVLLWVLSMLEFCFVPQTSQFRYVPHLYLCIVYALYYFMKNWKKKYYKFVNYFMIIIVVVNIIPWLGMVLYRTYQSTFTRKTLDFLGKECAVNDYRYQVSFFNDDFTGIFYNLKDYAIDYQYIDIADIDEKYKDTYSKWLYYRE